MKITKLKASRIALAGAASTLAIGAGLLHNAQAQLRPNPGVPNAGGQGNRPVTGNQGNRPNLTQREKACMRRLSKDLDKLAGQTKETIKARDKEIILGNACTIKVTKGLQIKAARAFIKENFFL